MSIGVTRTDIRQALRLHFEAQIKKHRINVEIYLNNAVGVAEHPDVLESIEKELEHIAEYHDKLEALNTYISEK